MTNVRPYHPIELANHFADEVEIKIQKLELQKGDLLVIKLKYGVLDSELEKLAENLRARLREYLGYDVKVLILDAGVELSIVSASDKNDC